MAGDREGKGLCFTCAQYLFGSCSTPQGNCVSVCVCVCVCEEGVSVGS